MAGVDVETSLFEPLIGMSTGGKRKSLSLKLRVPRLETEPVRNVVARSQGLQNPPVPPKYMEHCLVQVIEKTLASQTIPEGGYCKPWITVDLRKKLKAKKRKERDASLGEENHKITAKKKSKAKLETYKETDQNPKPRSLKVTFKTISKEPAASKGGEPSRRQDRKLDTSDHASSQTQTSIPQSSRPETSKPAESQAQSGDGGYPTTSKAMGMRADQGTQCHGGSSDKQKQQPSHSGSSAGTKSSLETSLANVARSLNSVDLRKDGRTAKEAFAKGRQMQREAFEMRRDQGYTMSIEAMRMCLEAALKYFEAAVYSESGEDRDKILLRTGKYLFSTVDKHGDKLECEDFYKKCFVTFAERLGVCTNMHYVQSANGSNAGHEVMHEAVRRTISTNKVLTDLRQQAQQHSCREGMVALIEALLRNGGMDPIEQLLHISKGILDKLPVA